MNLSNQLINMPLTDAHDRPGSALHSGTEGGWRRDSYPILV